jgi:hypothetical protein
MALFARYFWRGYIFGSPVARETRRRGQFELICTVCGYVTIPRFGLSAMRAQSCIPMMAVRRGSVEQAERRSPYSSFTAAVATFGL